MFSIWHLALSYYSPSLCTLGGEIWEKPLSFATTRHLFSLFFLKMSSVLFSEALGRDLIFVFNLKWRPIGGLGWLVANWRTSTLCRADCFFLLFSFLFKSLGCGLVHHVGSFALVQRRVTRLGWWVVLAGKGDGIHFHAVAWSQPRFFGRQLGQKSKCYWIGGNTKSWAKTFWPLLTGKQTFSLCT